MLAIGLEQVLGMIKVLDNIIVKVPVSLRAQITVDADVNAERVIIMNRETSEVYYNFKLVNSIQTFVVPYPHILNNTLLIGILDDNAVYDCKFADGVMAESVNVNA